VERVEIAWPSGRKQVMQDLEADRFMVVSEGLDRVVPQFVRNAPAR
jgi:hypothetical protein